MHRLRRLPQRTTRTFEAQWKRGGYYSAARRLNNHLVVVGRRRRLISSFDWPIQRHFSTEASSVVKSEIASDNTDLESASDVVADGETTVPEPLFRNKRPPNQMLNIYYSSELGACQPISALMRTSSTLHDGRLWWTASFECPLTKKKYEAGRLQDAVWIEVNNRIYYARKRSATNAAAGTAVDDIEYRTTGILNPRCCEDDPSVVETAGSADTTTDENVANDVDEVTNTISPANFAEAVVVEMSGEQSDGEFVILDVPISGGTAYLPTTAASQTNRSSDFFFAPDPRQSLRLAMKTAKTWIRTYHRNKHQQRGESDQRIDLHRVYLPQQQQSSQMLSAKSVLVSLASANQGVPFPSSSSKTKGVQPLATKILDILAKSSEKISIDVEIMNSYLKCLEGANPLLVANEAEKIVEEMKEQGKWKGHLLPHPNNATTDVLIQLWAQVGGNSGRYERMDSSFKPTRASFLAILSSAAYGPTVKDDPDVFDTDFAEQCIQRLQELSEENPEDHSLRPDTEVWNAPLRWNGGAQWPRTRPYARAIEWDKLDEMYKDGFQEVKDKESEIGFATRVETWIDAMEASPFASPNIESYESLIQAWTRTCTKEGMEKADEIGKGLLEQTGSEKAPRLQTYHPIIAGWLYCGDTTGLERVQWWLEKLFESSNEKDSLCPDSRLLEAYFSRQAAYQKSRMPGEEGSISLTSDMIDIGMSCTELLMALVQQPTPGATLQPAIFTKVMRIWHNSVVVCVEAKDEEKAHRCLDQITKVVSLFDDYLLATTRVEYSSGAGLKERKEPSEELLSLVSNAHHVHYAFAFTVRSIHAKGREHDVAIDGFEDILSSLEKMLRRSVEFREMEVLNVTPYQSGKSGNRMKGKQHRTVYLYDDLFRYSSCPRETSQPSREAYLWQLAQLLGAFSSEDVSAVDLVRFSHLLYQVATAMEVSPKLMDSIVLCCAAARRMDKEVRHNSPDKNTTVSQTVGEPHNQSSGRVLQQMQHLIPG